MFLLLLDWLFGLMNLGIGGDMVVMIFYISQQKCIDRKVIYAVNFIICY
jgi:hypothetical protein